MGGSDVKGMGAAIKGIFAAAALVVTYVDHTLSPLFWALLALAAIDVLLNVHDESKQLTKLGSAFVTMFGTYSATLAGHYGQPDFVRILVAIAVLAYLQIVVPQLLALGTRVAKELKTPTQKADASALIAALQAEVAQLKAGAQAQAGGGQANGTKVNV